MMSFIFICFTEYMFPVNVNLYPFQRTSHYTAWSSRCGLGPKLGKRLIDRVPVRVYYGESLEDFLGKGLQSRPSTLSFWDWLPPLASAGGTSRLLVGGVHWLVHHHGLDQASLVSTGRSIHPLRHCLWPWTPHDQQRPVVSVCGPCQGAYLPQLIPHDI